MLDEIEARLGHSPCESLVHLAHQVQVFITTVWKATKTSNLQPYKVRQVQVIEQGDYRF
jgi:recombinational DNA repair ATPase RecF